ncbi:MAG TPA: cytochrome B [Bacteroidetes bacterium]|nr:cytochrome B [Bacteroidota bacterium]
MNMLIHTHSGLRWIVLILLIAATFKALMKWRSNAPFTNGDRQLNLFTMIATHVQLVLGLILLFTSTKVSFTGAAMKDPNLRFFSVEHSAMMVLAVILITVGYSKSKNVAEEIKKFKTTFIYFFLALLLILAAIPWPFRFPNAGWF